MSCGCESGSAPKTLPAPEGQEWPKPGLSLHAAVPGRRGEELVPYGLFLRATGTQLGVPSEGCGTGLIPLHGLPESLLDPYEETFGSWVSEDMRACGCTASQALKAEAVLPALLGDRPASAAREDDGPIDRDDDPIRPTPGQSSEDDGPRTLPRDCTPSATVKPDDIRQLKTICRINLGPSALWGRDLSLSIPSSYEATRSRGEMKAAYLPEWLDLCAPAGASDWAQANRGLKYSSEKHPGLFWTSELGYYHGFLLHAMRTVYGCRGVLGQSTFTSALGLYLDQCRIGPSDIRSLENEGKTWLVSRSLFCDSEHTWIQVDSQGYVQIQGGTGGLATHTAFASMGRVWLCARQNKYRAALADYYLWWAWRAYSRAMDMKDRGERPAEWRFVWYVGLMCAKCAMAEIVATASLLVHELGHVFGNSYHCRDNSDEAVGGFLAGLWVALASGAMGPIGFAIPLVGAWLGSTLWGDGSKKDCCQYVLEAAFWARLTGLFGLPVKPHTVDPQGVDDTGFRFAASEGTRVSYGIGFGAGCEDPDSYGYWVLLNKLEAGTPVEFTWDVRAKCDAASIGGAKVVTL